MKSILKYKSFVGSVRFSTEDQVFHGKIEEISDLDTFEGITFGELEKSFEQHTGEDFVLFWNSPAIKELRENGLLML